MASDVEEVESSVSAEDEARELADRLGGVGCRRKRTEDARFIQGKGNYVDDIQMPGMVYGDFVRSPHAHARIKSINKDTALATPGVHAVLTAADLEPLGLHWMPTLAGDKQMVLADGKVCFQNQEVAMVIADDRYLAADATELVEVEYEELDPVVDPHQSMADEAPMIRDDLAGVEDGAHGKRSHHNHVFTWDIGDAEATDAVFNDAAVTVKQDMLYPRVHPCPLETCGCVASFDKVKGELTVHLTSQAPHVVRTVFSMLSGIAESKVHINSPDIGGGFGNKVGVYPGYVVATVASIVLGRPVKWVESRIENLSTTAFARDYHMTGELAATEEGRILGLRANVLADHGAFDACADPSKWPAGFFNICTGSYDIKTAYARVDGVYTNKAPGGVAYRCSFRVTEACYLIERMIDVLAERLGMDKAEIRLKNFIQPEQFPYPSALGWEYDSGDYPRALKQVMDSCDYDGLRREQREKRERGEIMGIGLCTFTEIVGAGPSRNCDILGVGMFDSAEIRVHPTGSVIARMGTKTQGQGHETTYGQIIASELGLPSENIIVEEGNTDTAPYGLGTYGSRSTPVAGAATAQAARKIRDKARKIAAHLMEVSEDDLEWSGEGFRVKGVPDQSTDMPTIAWAAYNSVPEGMEPGLEAVDYYDPPNMTFPFGAYLCVVDIDRYTGETRIRRFHALDDCGTRINPMVIEGQVHGGLCEAFAVAMGQELPFDGAGNIQGASLMDYFLPTMVETPEWETDHTVTPSPHHPIGAKGVGESSHVGGIPCFSNAINDALNQFGASHVNMPHNAYRVWQSLHELGLDQRPEAANVEPFQPGQTGATGAAESGSPASVQSPDKASGKGTEITIERNYPLDAPAAAAWDVLQDIHQVTGCMPGASIVERTGDSTYVGEMKLKVGPVTSAFKGDIEVLGIDPERRELRMTGSGGDSKGSSSASMSLTARIEDQGDGRSELVGSTRIELKGKLASFGGRMLENVSDRMLQQFVDSFRDRVAAGGEGEQAEAARRRVEQGPKEMNALAMAWQLIKSLFGRK